MSKFNEGTIIRQPVQMRKSDDFAARPTNISAVGHIVHYIEQ
jgi:hypothetical protein